MGQGTSKSIETVYISRFHKYCHTIHNATLYNTCIYNQLDLIPINRLFIKTTTDNVCKLAVINHNIHANKRN